MADRISNLLPPPPDWSDDKIRRYKAEIIEIYNPFVYPLGKPRLSIFCVAEGSQ